MHSWTGEENVHAERPDYQHILFYFYFILPLREALAGVLGCKAGGRDA